MDAVINIETKWIKSPPSGELCTLCSDPIFSETNTLYVIINNKEISTKAIVCNSCLDLIERPTLEM